MEPIIVIITTFTTLPDSMPYILFQNNITKIVIKQKKSVQLDAKTQ